MLKNVHFGPIFVIFALKILHKHATNIKKVDFDQRLLGVCSNQTLDETYNTYDFLFELYNWYVLWSLPFIVHFKTYFLIKLRNNCHMKNLSRDWVLYHSLWASKLCYTFGLSCYVGSHNSSPQNVHHWNVKICILPWLTFTLFSFNIFSSCILFHWKSVKSNLKIAEF